MSPRSKKEYSEATHLRYKNASRHEKTIILNEFCSTCGYHRKHATRLLREFRRFTKPKPKKRGRPPVYHNAVWGKGETGVLTHIKDIEKILPSPLLGFDCDNGSEFLNYHLLRHFTQRKDPVKFTRSRPYHKDDNAHVKQKNWTRVCQLLSYQRLDNPKIVHLLNNF